MLYHVYIYIPRSSSLSSTHSSESVTPASAHSSRRRHRHHGRLPLHIRRSIWTLTSATGSSSRSRSSYRQCPSYHTQQRPAKQRRSLLPSERYAESRHSTEIRPLTITTPSSRRRRRVQAFGFASSMTGFMAAATTVHITGCKSCWSSSVSCIRPRGAARLRQ